MSSRITDVTGFEWQLQAAIQSGTAVRRLCCGDGRLFLYGFLINWILKRRGIYNDTKQKGISLSGYGWKTS